MPLRIEPRHPYPHQHTWKPRQVLLRVVFPRLTGARPVRFAILFIDIDRFKDINDNYGHAIGDEAIREMTRICLENIRDSDILGRIGGDEFGVILQECGLGYATQTAEKLRERISNHIVSSKLGKIKFSISVGAVTVEDSDTEVGDTLKRADRNLYEAKRTGRNLVIAA